MKLSDYVMSFIADQGVKDIFMVPGGGCMHLVDSLGKNEKLRYISCLHEQACSFAAEAYGEYTGNLGAALVTTGPGGTNAVTGIAACWLESSAAIFIAGQAKTQDLSQQYGVRSMGQQEVDVVSIVKPITKYAVTVKNPKSIRYHLETAVYLAKQGRPGPVFIEIPLDVQSAEIDPDSLIGMRSVEVEIRDADLKKSVAKVISLLKESKRPVLLIGNGVRIGHGIEELYKLLENLKVPVLLTWKAMDMLEEEHPLYRGRPGGIGQRFANFTQQNSDCIIVIGSRLDLPSVAFDHRGFAPKAKKILVDVDPAEIMKFNTNIDVSIFSDAKNFLMELTEQLGTQISASKYQSWLTKTAEWQKLYPVVLPEYYQVKNGVSTYVLVEELSKLLNQNDLIVPGSSGACSDILMQAFKLKRGQRVLNAPSLGAMGTGIPGTMGACIASGGRRTICTNGDGGFQFNIQELQTIKRLNLPIKFFVLNNNGYGSITSSQTAHFNRKVGADPESQLTLPQIRRIAAAYDIDTALISKTEEIASVLSQVLNQQGPSIVEVMIHTEEKTAPRVTSKIVDGKIVSNPMEDMSPPLDREELLRNMTMN